MVIDKTLIISSAIIYNKKGEVLLLKRGETKTFQDHWQLPEGKLEENETPQKALKREIQEELRVQVKSSTLVSATATPLEAKGIKYLAFRMIFKVKLKADKITLSSEHSDYQWIMPNKVSSLELLPGTLEPIVN